MSASKSPSTTEAAKASQSPVRAPAEELDSEVQSPGLLPAGDVAAAGDATMGAQTLRLGDPRLQTVQRQTLAVQIGRLQGNRHLQRVVAALKGKEQPEHDRASGETTASFVTQRHAEGASLLPERETVLAEIQSPSPTGEQTATGATRPTEQAQTPATPAPREGTTTTAPPTPVSSNAMDLSRAQTILQTAYGGVRQIVPGSIVLLADNAAMWTRYDQVARGRNNIYVTPNRPWQDGDAQAAFPLGLNGFQDGGTVYVNQQTTSPTTTAHEMLHMNTAAGFRSAMGETINEGATQYLAVKALTAAGVTMPAVIPYADELALVRALVDMVGEDRLIQAYFNGGTAINELIGRVDLSQGEGTFATLRQLGDAREFTRAADLLKPGGGTQQERQPITETSEVLV